MIDSYRVDTTTDSSEDASFTIPTTGAGRLLGLHIVSAGTPDVVITDDLSHELFNETGMANGARRYPRDGIDSIAGVALTYDGTRLVSEAQPFVGSLNVVVANGGVSTAFAIILWWEI
jgi:hypothetical protein